MIKFKDRNELWLLRGMTIALAAAAEWRRDGIAGSISHQCHTFLTFWFVKLRGGVLCAVVTRERTKGRRPTQAV